jgi:hypothetical protein
MVDRTVAGGAGRSRGAGVAVVEALEALHDGYVSVPADGALVVAQHLGNVVVGMGDRTVTGLVVHVAPLHTAKGVGSACREPDGSRSDSVGRVEVELRKACVDREGVHAVDEVRGNNVGRDDDGEGWLVVVGRGNYSVVEVVVAHGLNGCLIEDHSGEAAVLKPHNTGRVEFDLIETAVEEGEAHLDIHGSIRGVNTHVVHEGQEDVLVSGVQGDSCRGCEVDGV